RGDLGPLVLNSGVPPTVLNGTTSFLSLTLNRATGTFTIDKAAGNFIPGDVASSGAITLAKLGEGNLVLNYTPDHFATGAAIEVAVRGVVVLGPNAFVGATVNLDGGSLNLSTSTFDLSYEVPVNIVSNATIAAGHFGV